MFEVSPQEIDRDHVAWFVCCSCTTWDVLFSSLVAIILECLSILMQKVCFDIILALSGDVFVSSGTVQIMSSNNDSVVRVFDCNTFSLIKSFSFPWAVNVWCTYLLLQILSDCFVSLWAHLLFLKAMQLRSTLCWMQVEDSFKWFMPLHSVTWLWAVNSNWFFSFLIVFLLWQSSLVHNCSGN